MAEHLTLLIIDDERIIREGLRDMVDWHELGFHVEACLGDGQEAIDYLSEHPVNAVLTDIKMDDVSGIGVSQFVAERFPDTKIVLLSGYRDFDYARQAIMYNVYRYLVKPVDFAELEAAFLDIRKEIYDERSRLVSSGDDGHKWKELLPQARRQFITDLVGGRLPDDQNIAVQLEQLELPFTPDQHPCSLIRMAVHFEADNPSESARFGFLKTITSEVEQTHWYEIHNLGDQLIALVVSTVILSSDEFEAALAQRIDSVCRKVKEVFHLNLTVDVIASLSCLSEMAHARQLQQIKTAVNAATPMRTMETHQDPIVDRVLKYLSSNYGSEVSLSRAAEKAYLSPVYFSKYIKERTGKTFTEHLTNVRVGRAIDLLRENQQSIGEIAGHVGYANPRYFSRVFRKHTGYGPREYRTQVLSREIDDE